MVFPGKAQLIAERDYEEIEQTSCGPAMSDHDWTIHIPAHSHSIASWKSGNSRGGRFESHPDRIVHAGPDSNAVLLAVATHPNSAYAECNWCALKYDGVKDE